MGGGSNNVILLSDCSGPFPSSFLFAFPRHLPFLFYFSFFSYSLHRLLHPVSLGCNYLPLPVDAGVARRHAATATIDVITIILPIYFCFSLLLFLLLILGSICLFSAGDIYFLLDCRRGCFSAYSFSVLLSFLSFRLSYFDHSSCMYSLIVCSYQ